MISEKLLKPYDPKEVEGRIYKLWEESGFLNPDKLLGKREKTFTILMPPTNANGSLHAGHGLVLTIEDIMIRYKRMAGFKSLWLPGTDHAGFETQVVYEKKLEKEGRSRFGMNPKDLYDEILDFTLKNKKNMEEQTKKLGASCDWSREKFTLDKDIIETTYQTFKKLSDDKLLYRGKQIINWCSKHQTSLSDLETKDEEQEDKYYYLKYGPFIISTARPETKFGDKYVVMHPNDKRYKDYQPGQKIDLEWINGPITATIIKDKAIDMKTGTGVMTITPWHSRVDFEIAERHNLDKKQIIDFDGKLLPIAGEFEGINIKKARAMIIEKLQKKGLVEKIEENYKHLVQTCYKCHTIIEPQIKSQWFIKMKPLAKKAMGVVEKDKITYLPSHYKKITLHWLNNIMDWNISRQIIWGIPIPAKLCLKCDSGIVDIKNKITKCPKCSGEVNQDPDTFDTWFSSGQWPFASLGYPNSKDYKEFYPIDVMETAGEIIFFWVTRMIMLSLYITNKVPFKTIYLHGLVLDAMGQKMSKSKGNVIDPIKLTEKYGTDAFRIALIIGNTPGTSLALAENRIKGYKHFANKIWNATRFVLSNLNELDVNNKPTLTQDDQNLLNNLKTFITDITADMENFRFHLAGEKVYHYFWHKFADVIIEESKEIIKNGSINDRLSKQWTLLEILKINIKILHPFMPFITEEIWSIIPNNKNLLMVEPWNK
ncbi:valine--tRNA ligase [Candidatus Nomurabacteria bacterium RIFCSPLOWO2_01_FULL_33_24]|uniref:Valine--tRNA ligase n=1 Tax=Candidatus Nomurabacteria bacterium RIFCSPLOWO2_01_FULL_33_24 TaxID=1801765 RepID=A0A1F6X2U3_9BACT|nr:MAG: valine--tRNA ligase [Candidatus Nomurabacteria bacterium RIFCSPLOWO2_01_FULL_33_24]